MIEIQPNGRFAAALKEAAEEQQLSLAELGQRVDSSYEHMRKLVAGRAHPSPRLLRDLAKELGVDATKFQELVNADKFHKQFKVLPKAFGISPELEPFEPIIPKLSEEGRQTLLAVARSLLNREKAHSK